MATFTAAQAHSYVSPRGIHTGVWAVSTTVSLTAAVSAGDVFLMARVPAGATVLSVQRNFAAGTGNDFIANVGLSADASASAFGTATGAAGILWMTKGVPWTVSASDGAAEPRGAYLQILVGTVTSASATGSLNLVALLTNDP